MDRCVECGGDVKSHTYETAICPRTRVAMAEELSLLFDDLWVKAHDSLAAYDNADAARKLAVKADKFAKAIDGKGALG